MPFLILFGYLFNVLTHLQRVFYAKNANNIHVVKVRHKFFKNYYFLQ